MRRLSIIDLAGGHQPMANEDESVWMVFNGEIYNFRPLRRDLERLGHRFRTSSDTEVIVHGYEEYGDSVVERLDGMFAFAIWDRRRGEDAGRLLLARDRLGKKPLYYADGGGRLVFGSELKPVVAHPDVSKDIDVVAVHHYLSLLVVPAPWSIFRSVRKLRPAHVLECSARGVSVRRYWDYHKFVGVNRMTAHEARGEVRARVFRAVQKRLVADVPLGAFLSGGLDSSAVVAVMSKLSAAPVKTFSVGFAGTHGNQDELPFARSVARHCRTEHREFVVRPDVVELLAEVVRFADEPFAISSAMATLLMARKAREFVTVVLTGDGGDEVFGGYEHYVYERWAALYRRQPRLIDGLLERAAKAAGRAGGEAGARWERRVRRFVANARLGIGQRRLGWASGFGESEKRRILAGAGVGPHPWPDTSALLEEHLGGVPAVGPDALLNCMDMTLWLADEMLAKVDRMTMAASLEARCPLLDLDLVELMASISLEDKMHGLRMSGVKHLARHALADLLPPEVVARRKQGFNVPLDSWFRGESRPFLESTLSRERTRARGVFDPDAVAGLLESHKSGRVQAANRLFALLTFEVWAQWML
jgi:asparagine synthase (glutamine-hydrolysing)